MMAKEKYCPINSHPQSDGMCQKEKCAWWNSSEKNCAVSMLAHYVSMLWEHRYHVDR